MRVLVGCESSGVVRDAFRTLGHDAWSCDLLPCEGDPAFHMQRDVVEAARDGWDLAILHPPCTFLSVSGLHWNKRITGRSEKTEGALHFVRRCLALDVPRLRLDEGFHSSTERRAARAAGVKPRPRLTTAQNLATPHAFRDLLLSIARGCATQGT